MNLNEQAKIKARMIFEKHHLHCPVDLYYLAKNLNIEIREFNMPEKLSGFARKMRDVWWADNKFLIILNKNQSFYRKRFTITHEIGHIVLNHKPMDYTFSFHDIEEHKDKKLAWIERQADVFATELLMPKNIFLDMYFNRNIKDVSELQKLFGVSRQAVEIRIEQITKLFSFDQLSLF